MVAGIDKQPQLWHNPWAGLYIVAVCFFLGLFWVNLLQGAIIDNYCRLIEQMGSGALVCCACCAAHDVLYTTVLLLHDKSFFFGVVLSVEMCWAEP